MCYAEGRLYRLHRYRYRSWCVTTKGGYTGYVDTDTEAGVLRQRAVIRTGYVDTDTEAGVLR